MVREQLKRWKSKHPNECIDKFSLENTDPIDALETQIHQCNNVEKEFSANNAVIRYDPKMDKFCINLSCSNPSCVQINRGKVYQTPPCIVQINDSILREMFGMRGLDKNTGTSKSNNRVTDERASKKPRPGLMALDSLISSLK